MGVLIRSHKRQQADWACGADAARQLREFAQIGRIAVEAIALAKFKYYS